MKRDKNNLILNDDIIESDKIAAHDINNLFSSIFASIELLKRELAGKPDALYLLENIEHCSHRATEITTRVLSDGASEINRDGRINTRLLINEVISAMIQSLPERIKIVTEIESVVSDLRGNSTELYQVLVNLMMNAAEAIVDTGEIRIIVKDASNYGDSPNIDGDSHPKVRLSVIDDGIGIKPEDRVKIFSPYYSTKNKGRTSGIGLFSVKKIIDNHNGVIDFKSEPGYGTRFDIILPAYCARRKIRKGDKINILIADDETLLVSILEDLLSAAGHQISTVPSAEEAIEHLHSHDGFDLLIIDLRMNGLDGISGIREIRKFNQDIKIILSTGTVGIKNMEFPKDARVDATLQKPYELETLLTLIDSMVD
jgi:CheY-like chemotaxis protein